MDNNRPAIIPITYTPAEKGWVVFVLILAVTASVIALTDRYSIQDIIEPTWECRVIRTNGPIRDGDNWVAYRLKECWGPGNEPRLYGGYEQIFSFNELDLEPHL